MHRKTLLEHQIRLAFAEDDEMSLMASIDGLGDEVMELRLTEDSWTIGEILYHTAACKIGYCQEGWQSWTEAIPQPFDDIAAMRDLLVEANDHLLECLYGVKVDELDDPLPLSYNGASAFHFFSVMAMHDTAHAAQVRAALRFHGERSGGLYPVVG